MPRRRPLAAVLVLLLVGALAACSSDGPAQDSTTPAQRLAAAEQQLDGTSGLRVRLTTDGLDEGITGITGAEGVVAHPPAFEGTLSVQIAGQSFEVPVVSVDGTVYAKLPFTTTWSRIDPAEYGAPDPARLISRDGGLSALLPATREPTVEGTVRGGKNNTEVLTSISGTLPGRLVSRIIPSASGTFEVTYRLTGDDTLREVVLSGSFYPAPGEMTYTVTLRDYGIDPAITAPTTAR